MNLAKILKNLFLIVLILVLIAGAFLYLRPLPSLQPTTIAKTPQSTIAVAIPWPSYGQSALGASGLGVVASSGIQKPTPIASVAKVMTALAVLKQKPLEAGDQGPMLTINAADVAVYNDYFAKGGSVAKVVAGEKISEYQALQAMLLPSANNFADTLVTWAFGSLDNYIVYAKNLGQSFGLQDTHIADASGFLPQTFSSARDLVALGEVALKNPVLVSIVAQQQTEIPEAGLVKNTNWLLGSEGVIGIKTGNTAEAGGCYLFAAKRHIENKDITVIGAILGSPDRNTAISDSKSLIQASDKGFQTQSVVKAGEVVGYYKAPWGARSSVVAKQDAKLFTWRGQTVKVSTKLVPAHASSAKDIVVGSIEAKINNSSITSPAILQQKIGNPSLKWRIFNR